MFFDSLLLVLKAYQLGFEMVPPAKCDAVQRVKARTLVAASDVVTARQNPPAPLVV